MRVMIVEDELALARGLAQMIDRTNLGCEVVGLYKNGALGLRACTEIQPDVVIVDINMPVMNGIELIAAEKEKCPETQFVILTGYAMFDYAQSALKLGVKDYLLKPISTAALEKVLVECRDRLKDTLRKKQEKYIFDCVVKREHIAAAADANPLHAWKCVFLILHLGATKAPSICAERCGIDVDETMQKHSVIPKIQPPTGVCLYLTGIIHGDMAVYTAVTQGQTAAFETLAQKLLETCQRENLCANLTISRVAEDGHGLWETCMEAYRAGWHLHRFGASMAYYVGESDSSQIHVSHEIRKICAAFSNSLQDGEDSAKMAGMLCTEWRQRQPTLAQLNMELQFVFGQLSRICKKEIAYPNTERIIMDCCTFETLEERLCVEINTLCGLHTASDESYKKRLAEEVKNWLDQHYTSAFSYKVFPAVFGYHEKYVSLIFKEAYGLTPNRYVEDLRLEMAKKLLKENPEMLLAEVAMRVGYSNQFYFSKVFKKREYMSPTEYANGYRDGKKKE